MKKISLLFFAFFLYTTSHAQDKKMWLDLEIEQNLGLNNWFNNDNISKPIRKNSSTDIKTRLNLLLNNKIGLYADLALSFYRYNNNYQEQNILNEYNLNNYYLRNHFFESNHNSPGGRLTFGLFYKFRFDKFSLTPYLGYGFEQFDMPSASYTSKEKDTNNLYDVNYFWLPDEYNFLSIKNSILSVQLLSSYRISKQLGLLFGISYRYRLNKMRFRTEIRDYYDDRLIDEINVSGNNVQTIGISVGTSFEW